MTATLQELIDKGFKGAAKKLDDIDLGRIASTINCSEDHLHAFLEVESNGSGFDSQGRPKILFEPHLFYKLLGPGAKRDLAVSQGLAYPKWGQQKYPKESYTRLFKACKIDPDKAVQACSWGMTQILGSNFKMIKYKSPAAMVEAFMDDEENHVQACVNFLVAAKLDKHLRNHNWAAVAKGYNGPGYAKNKYDTKMKKAFEKWQKIPDTPYENLRNYLIEKNENKDPNTVFEAAPVSVEVQSIPETNKSVIVVKDEDDNVIAEQEFVPPTVTVKKGTFAEQNLTSEQIKYIQTRLRDLGYFIVGKVDGKWEQGGKVTAAISALQEQCGIEPDGHYGPATRAALARNDGSNKAKISKARESTTVDNLRDQGSRTIAATDGVKTTAIVTGGSVALGTAVNEASNAVITYAPDAVSWITPIKELFLDVPTWVWIIVFLAVCAVLWYQANKAQKARLDDERTGVHNGLPAPASEDAPVSELSPKDERLQEIPSFLINKDQQEETVQVTK